MPHTQGTPKRTPQAPPTAHGSSSHQPPPSYPPPRPTLPIPGSLDPMKKRLLRAWDDNDDSTPTVPAVARPSSFKRRRYPKLLTVDKNGKLIANPLRIPTNTPPPVPLTPPVPSNLSSSPSESKPSPAPVEPHVAFARSTTRPRRRVIRQRAMRVAGAAPLVLRPVFTDRNGEIFSLVFRPTTPVKLPPNPMDEVCERPHLGQGIVEVEQLQDEEPGDNTFVTAEQRSGGGQSFAKGKDRREEEKSVENGQEGGGGGGAKSFARGRGSGARTGSVFNPTAIAQRPVKGTSASGGSEEAAVASDGRVIQVGRRSGTVHYWRSSLQMPKRKDKVLGVKQRGNDVKAEDARAEGNVGRMKAPGNGQMERGQGKGVAEPGGRRPMAVDARMGHEYSRGTVRLPLDGSEHTRQGMAGSGGGLDAHMERGFLPEVRTGVRGVSAAGSSSREFAAVDSVLEQGGGGRKSENVEEDMGDLKGMQAQKALEEERSEIRRLHMTKNYEIRKLEAYAESRYHVRMNLRGRLKLENWLSSEDPVASNSVLFIVLVLNLDRRLVSKEARDRREALGEMNNEHLRMLEALMARTSTRDGYTNWGVLTANFTGDRTA